MAAEVDIGAMIISSPDIRGGRPRVAGTGITVMRVAGWYRLGCTPEDIARKTGLSLAQIHAALAYYHADPEYIDADLDSEAREYDRLAEEQRLKRLEEQKRYRKRMGHDTWHFCSNCSNWPSSDFETRLDKPAIGELCNECKSKSASGNCS